MRIKVQVKLKRSRKKGNGKKEKKRKRESRLDGKGSEITIAKTIGYCNITYQIKIEITYLCELSVKL